MRYKTAAVHCAAMLLSCAIMATLAKDLSTGGLNSNPFIKKYGKINYDPANLHAQHARSRRSAADKDIFFAFNSHGRNFKIKLRASERSFFENRNVEMGDALLDADRLGAFYEGSLLDEPGASYVSGTIIDGVFYGSIESRRHGTFHVESARRYNHTLDAHSIIYHEDDVSLEPRRAAKRSADDDDGHLGCGSMHDRVKSWMKHEQKSLYDERRKIEGFDPFSYVDKDKYRLNEDTDEHGPSVNKYSREANEKQRRKRDSGAEPKRLSFPDQRTMCDLYLRVDPQLHTEIFNNEGSRDPDKTTAFLLFYLNKHVEALNTIYNGLQFFDTNKESYFVGLQFMIYRTKIITEEHCTSKLNLTNEELRLCEPYLDVSTFLNYVSLDNFNDYCLSYTFTARDFTDGTLGLAWVAKLTGSVGGVCERRQTLQGVQKSLNSGIVTVVNYQARVPEAVSQITFAHEVGHNFGSEHDPDDTNCSPGINRGGNFIMYRRATTGTDKNNRNFSACSKDQMGPIVHSLVLNPTKFCFKQYNGSLCGNGIVEPGEECDCGYSNECKETQCCYDADEKSGDRCKLKPGAKCSPSQGACCDNTCSYATSSTVCMQSDECLKNVTCTGKNAYCPRNSSEFFKPSLTTCNSGTQVCKNGICSGSICERYDMVQCYLEGNLKDKSQDKAVLCHLACIGERTDNKCVDSFIINEMVNPATNSGFILKPGSPCIGTLGYCDRFSKCRSVDGEGPLSRLKNFIFNPVTLSTIRGWVTTYWWAVMLMVIGLLVFMIAFIKVCSVHTPSSNPRKPPALKISETLRRPIKRIPHPHLHLHRSTHQPSVPPASSVTVAAPKQRSGKPNTASSMPTTSNGAKPAKKTSSKDHSPTKHGHHHARPVAKSAPHQHTHHSGDSKDKSRSSRINIFNRRHKSGDPIHYYNNNHPLHPLPHHRSTTAGGKQHAGSSSKDRAARSGKGSATATTVNSANRSKSQEPRLDKKEAQAMAAATAAAAANISARSRGDGDKVRSKTTSSSLSPSKKPRKDESAKKKPAEGLSSKPVPSKKKKRSSTETSSVEA